MNKIINQYLIINYSKILANSVLVFFVLGIVLNLFEEIEFFKDLGQPFGLPLILSLSFIPTLLIELLPFIVFLASVFYFLRLKSNKDLLSIKIFGYSNLKITLIVAFFTFLFGFFILFTINPITSKLIKYYETEKATHARDVVHLISINKNGIWIKEVDETGYKIISAENIENDILKNISIFVFDNSSNVLKRIESKSATISSNPWIMDDVIIYNFSDNTKNMIKTYEFKTDNVLEKINSLYRNLNTLSFLDIIKNYEQLNEIGYSKRLLNEQIHKFVSLPFFLSLMVILASIFTIGTTNPKQNYYYILLSIFVSVIIFYFKDLSVALGQTDRISLTLSVWMPVIAVGLFCSIGVIQINEK